MAAWYVRRAVPGVVSLTNPKLPKTETVVSIASVQGYWRQKMKLHALAYNLGNFLRTLATPEPIKD
jgi:hypothetical protein